MAHFFCFYSDATGLQPNVTLKYRSKDRVKISWETPSKLLWNDGVTEYEICYSYKERSKKERDVTSCLRPIPRSQNSLVIMNLRPATKYFVTVTAITSSGSSWKSKEISTITNAGKA